MNQQKNMWESMKVKTTFCYDNVPPVKTKYGLLQGFFWRGAYIFRGIPYAQARRFEMPQPPASWEGIREAASYGYVSPLLAQDNPNMELLVPHRYWPQDEHCQNLNIWSPVLDRNAKKPVLVWLHGGAFSAGSSIEQVAYDGLNLCCQGDVVVVTVNHRLNILGYLDVSSLGEKYRNSANAGHADLVAALRWIQENIEVFGGDPGNVTIFGQSGGGMKVTGLMQIPEADGLFHKGVVMSGVFDGGLIPAPSADGRQITKALMDELDLAADESCKLAEIPYHTLAGAYNKVSPAIAKAGGYTGCVPMPNAYYKGEPLLEGLTEHAKTIPLIVGTVFGEFSFRPSLYQKYDLSKAQVQEILATAFGGRSDQLMDAFAAAYPGKSPIDLLVLDRVMRAPSKQLARLLAKEGKAPVYLYNFILEFPYQHKKAAWHCADIPFFFHNTDKVEVCHIPVVTERLEKQMFGALAAFARTGNPNHTEIPPWPAVDANREFTMIFDAECWVGENYDDDLLALYDEIAPPVDYAALLSQDVQH